MKIRPLVEADLPEVLSWLENQSWTLPPVDGSMPPHALLLEDEQGLVAAAWLYSTESSACFLEWITSNPTRSQEYRLEAKRALIRAVIEMGPRISPPIALYAVYTKDRTIVSLLKDLGFWIKPEFYQATFIVGKSELPGIPDAQTEE